jgi:hypothetical protein
MGSANSGGLSPDSKFFYGELTVRNLGATTAAPHKVVIVMLSVLE